MAGREEEEGGGLNGRRREGHERIGKEKKRIGMKGRGKRGRIEWMGREEVHVMVWEGRGRKGERERDVRERETGGRVGWDDGEIVLGRVWEGRERKREKEQVHEREEE